MIKRFFAIKVFSDTSDDKLIELMPTRQVENKLRALQDDLRDFKSASKNFRATIMDFAVPAARHAGNDGDEDCDDFADRALRARKKQWVAAQVYGAVRFIPPTSNAVERLFSKARHVLSLHRHNMLPIRLEMLMLL
ncbi:hypothetical protein JG687_00019091 [Phytophthora cactorum]|uniref:HAT C-terminal dimerisation domain-containing protein n=1 Tax=Phytophthora cactorum TaxID=29920 RepID=A0A8T1TL92_9STRA|nr:hypothetical protein JG687_00019091 [Phytophthora cactorum]